MDRRLNRNRNFLLLLTILCCSPQCRGMEFDIHKVDCKSLDTSFSYFKTCEVWTKNGSTTMNIYVVLRYKKPIDDITLSLTLFRVTKAYRMPLINETIDFCEYYRHGLMSNLYSMALNPIIRNSNVNHSCPYQHDIIIKGTETNEKFSTQIPAPKGKYILNVRVGAFKKWKADIKLYTS